MMHIEDLRKQLQETQNTLTELQQKQAENKRYIKISEDEIFDLEHLLENRKTYKLTAPVLTKISLEISDVRNKRRDAKDENFQLARLIPHYQSIFDKTKVQLSLLEKEEAKQLQPIYRPRSKVYERLGVTTKTIVIEKN